MKSLFKLKNKIEDIYSEHPFVSGLVIRFVLALAGLFILRSNLGFNQILSHIVFVILFAAVCSFLPVRLMILALSAYTVVQIFSLSAGAGIIACIFFLIIYLVYFRFNEKMGFLLIIIPLLSMIKLPGVVLLVLAVAASMSSVVCLLLGHFVFFFLHFISTYTPVLQGLTEENEITKMSMLISGFFTYREMWMNLACVAVTFFAVYYLKKLNLNRSNEMAISAGAGIFLILLLASNIMIGSINYTKLLEFVIGTVASLIVAMIITVVILPLDYNRTQLLEFEDEEYKYFVRAVPKAAVSKESVKIKRIYARRSVNPKGKEER